MSSALVRMTHVLAEVKYNLQAVLLWMKAMNKERKERDQDDAASPRYYHSQRSVRNIGEFK